MTAKVSDEEIKTTLLTMSARKAAKHLGISERTLWNRKSKLARQGWSPDHDMTKQVPDGFHLKGTSTLYDADGVAKLQWVKSSIDHQRQEEMMQEAVKAMAADIKPAKAIKPPKHTIDKLLNCYVITDYHLGAKSWGEETGADWDVQIAEQLLVDWFGAAIAQSPDAATGIFAQLGDFLHYDGILAVTPSSGHILDADTRFQKIIRVAIGAIRRITAMLLLKHERVILLMAEGNHDISSSMWLRELFAALYSDEPRIEVITRPDPYYCVEHGLTSIFFHHGHKKKLEMLETVFVGKFREIYGRTKYSYAHTGHLHHNVMLERNTMQLEQHRTLASPDSHASRGGWLSGRDAKVITYHKDRGDVGRIIISVDMIEGAAA